MRTGGREAFDVAVVGGGSAGIAAALAASRLGAHTLLAEAAPNLGGNASGALVQHVEQNAHVTGDKNTVVQVAGKGNVTNVGGKG